MAKLFYQGLTYFVFVLCLAFIFLAHGAKSDEGIFKLDLKESPLFPLPILVNTNACLFAYAPGNTIPNYSIYFSFNGVETVISTMIPGVSFSEVANVTSINARLIDQGSITIKDATVHSDETGTQNLLQLKVDGDISDMLEKSYGIAFIVYYNDESVTGETFYRMFWLKSSALTKFRECSANLTSSN